MALRALSADLRKLLGRPRPEESDVFAEESPLLRRLDPAQREAVRDPEGPVVILSTAGSGKTRVLTHRIAHMIEQGIPPSRILAITFTNKAARVLRDRLSRLVGARAGEITVGTFHAVGARILRRHGSLIGVPQNYTILDQRDQLVLLKKLWNEEGRDSLPEPRELAAAINRFKDSGEVDPNRVPEYWDRDLQYLYQRYQARLRELGALDFGDLLQRTTLLLETRPEAREHYQREIHYVLVDEVQDNNPIQNRLTDLLAGSRQNLTVVGDPQQAIFGFRGASPEYLEHFCLRYPRAREVRLATNYRSTGSIVRASAAVGKGVLAAQARSAREPGDPIRLHIAQDPEEEARWVAGEILRHRERYPDASIAVLYRTNAQSRSLESAFRRFGVPYVLLDDVGFYHRQEVLDALAYLRVLLNPGDELAALRLAQTPRRGIGRTVLGKLTDQARARHVPLGEYLPQASVSGAGKKGVARLATDLQMLRELYQQGASLLDLLDFVYDAIGLWGFYENQSRLNPERLENLQELRAVILDFEGPALETLPAFLDLATMSQSREEGPDPRAVALSTIHAAKGLEWRAVFVVGCEENLLPHYFARPPYGSEEELAEEQRLCYVAMTRAMDHLWMTWSRTRYQGDNFVLTSPSRFLEELPAALVQEVP